MKLSLARSRKSTLQIIILSSVLKKKDEQGFCLKNMIQFLLFGIYLERLNLSQTLQLQSHQHILLLTRAKGDLPSPAKAELSLILHFIPPLMDLSATHPGKYNLAHQLSQIKLRTSEEQVKYQ